MSNCCVAVAFVSGFMLIPRKRLSDGVTRDSESESKIKCELPVEWRGLPVEVSHSRDISDLDLQ